MLFWGGGRAHRGARPEAVPHLAAVEAVQRLRDRWGTAARPDGSRHCEAHNLDVQAEAQLRQNECFAAQAIP